MNFIAPLLEWYSKNKRDLPWRTISNPYNIWISEIIFQQTRINQGTQYYLNFIKKFPDIESLATSSVDDVLHIWQGLGYYTRAHNLHYTAQYIQGVLQGVFPSTYLDLLTLKGVGKYTAAAIASVSFNERVPAIDGNAFRVYSRLWNCHKDISKASTFTYFFNLMLPLMPDNPGDFNQAVMDLGALICLPKNPKCNSCPVTNSCQAYKNNSQNNLPVKTSKLKITKEKLHYAFIVNQDQTLIVKRDTTGIWKGLYEFPLFNSYCTQYNPVQNYSISHKLSHKILHITISEIHIKRTEFYKIARINNALLVNKKELKHYAFPKPIEKFLAL